MTHQQSECHGIKNYSQIYGGTKILKRNKIKGLKFQILKWIDQNRKKKYEDQNNN